MQEEKKLKQAVALKYDTERDNAPKITASGHGIVADNILKKGQEGEVLIHEDSKLVKELIQFKVGAEIPKELYEVVAQILAFVEMVDAKKAISNK